MGGTICISIQIQIGQVCCTLWDGDSGMPMRTYHLSPIWTIKMVGSIGILVYYTYLIKDVRASVLRVSARTSYKCSFEVAENQNKVHWHRCSGSLTLDSALNSFRSLQLALAGFIQVVYIGRQVHTTIQHSVVRWHQHRILYYYAEELFRYICANALLCTQYYTSRISSEEQFWREKVAQAAKKRLG